ncbi:hypothetical protein CU048_10700 [Beijerinckiaceae bacterium]|nr:hypothetical protein CU048_10700 [Beijerinckiaceae bacterium]
MQHIDRQISIWAGWIAAPAIGIIMMAAPNYLRLQPPLSGVLFWGGIAVFLVTIVVVASLSIHDERKRPKVMWPIITMAIGLMIFCGGAAWYFWSPTQDAPQRDASDAIFEIGGAKHTTVENNRIVGDVGNRKAFNIQGKETTIVRGNEVIDKVPEPKAQQNIEFIGVSNTELKKAIAEFTGRMRQFETIHDKKRSDLFSRSKPSDTRSAEQIKQDSDATISEYGKLIIEKKHEFDTNLAPRARAIEGEILWRLQLSGVSKVEWPNDFTHRTISIGYKQFQFDSLAGASPVANIADYLDYLASLLHD